MKLKVFILGLLALLLLVAVATRTEAQTNAPKVFTWVESGDTLGTSTTLTYEPVINGSTDKSKLWAYDILVEADSVSGANAGTVTLQISNDPPGTLAGNVIWFDLDSDTIDGSDTQVFHYTGTLYARRLRVVVTSPSGTRSTDIELRGVLRQLPQ